jgi:hypothetical protein
LLSSTGPPAPLQIEPPAADVGPLLDSTFVDCNRNGVVDDEDLADGIDADANDNGWLDGCEPFWGDIDEDGDVDLRDRQQLLAAIGHGEGEPAYRPLADLDDDQIVSDLDYELWTGHRERWLAAAAAAESTRRCGLLGLEALPLLVLWGAWRRARR